MSRRAHISWKTKYAAALLALADIPYVDAKEMTEDQIISLYQVDHGILHAIDPINLFWNLTPKLIAPHRRKSAEDKGIVSKSDRLVRSAMLHRAQMEAKAMGRPGDEQPRSMRKMPSRPFGKKPNRSFRGKNAWARV